MVDTRIGSAELFPTDAPLAGDALIGRADDVDAIARALVGGGNVVVAGPRRTGKTSVCDAAVAVCRAERCYTATVDLFELADAADLAEALSLRVLANRPPLARAIDAAGRVPERLLQAMSVAATYRARADLGEDVEITFSPRRARADPARALRTAMQLPERIGAADDRRVVVFLDEFQEISSGLYGPAEVVTRQLRATLQRSPHVSVLFAGSMEHLMRELFAPGDRALSQFGAFHELGPIGAGQWHEGLRERLALDGCEITDGAVARIVELGDDHPRATMLIAQQAHSVAVAELSRRLDEATVGAGLRAALRAERLKHEQTLERIRSLGRYAQRLAQRVAVGANLYEGLTPQTAASTLNRLRDAGIVDRVGRAHSGRWHVFDPLLRRYLADLPGAR